MANEIPSEITEAADLMHTAVGNLTAAEDAEKAAREELGEAHRKHDAAEGAMADAATAEEQARRDYIAALRRHGYVQTADGPRPAEVIGRQVSAWEQVKSESPDCRADAAFLIETGADSLGDEPR